LKWQIPVAKPDIGNDEIEAVTEVLKSGWITQGENVLKFENKFSKFCMAKYGIATSSGTSALHAALAVCGVSKGDNVITTPLSCIASSNPILLQGALPIFIDTDKRTFNIDVDLIKSKITNKTKAILVVHLFGHPVDMDPLMELAEKYDLKVIEDAAQAMGAMYKGKRAGSIGHISCFSLYANKIITTGEGGMIVTKDSDLDKELRSIRNLGEDDKLNFCYPRLGYNYKMTDLQASIGLIQLSKIDRLIVKRRKNIIELNNELEGYAEIESLPLELDYAHNVYFSYYIQMRDPKLRNKMVQFLGKSGIETRPFFCLIPDQQPYRRMGYTATRFKNSLKSFENGFYISNSPSLTHEDKSYIINSIKKGLR
jgi:perosamine synthetase